MAIGLLCKWGGVKGEGESGSSTDKTGDEKRDK